MNRRAFFTCLTAALAIPAGQALAATVADEVIAQLGKQGFSDISSETTWLGRLRIVAHRKDGQREIVINPRTGEILRDQWTAISGGTGSQPILDTVGGDQGGSDGGGSSGSGSSGSGTSGDGSSDGGSGGDGSSAGSGDDSGSDKGSGGGSGSGKGSDGGGDGGGDGKGKDD